MCRSGCTALRRATTVPHFQPHWRKGRAWRGAGASTTTRATRSEYRFSAWSSSSSPFAAAAEPSPRSAPVPEPSLWSSSRAETSRTRTQTPWRPLRGWLPGAGQCHRRSSGGKSRRERGGPGCSWLQTGWEKKKKKKLDAHETTERECVEREPSHFGQTKKKKKKLFDLPLPSLDYNLLSFFSLSTSSRSGTPARARSSSSPRRAPPPRPVSASTPCCPRPTPLV